MWPGGATGLLAVRLEQLPGGVIRVIHLAIGRIRDHLRALAAFSSWQARVVDLLRRGLSAAKLLTPFVRDNTCFRSRAA